MKAKAKKKGAAKMPKMDFAAMMKGKDMPDKTARRMGPKSKGKAHAEGMRKVRSY